VREGRGCSRIRVAPLTRGASDRLRHAWPAADRATASASVAPDVRRTGRALRSPRTRRPAGNPDRIDPSRSGAFPHTARCVDRAQTFPTDRAASMPAARHLSCGRAACGHACLASCSRVYSRQSPPKPLGAHPVNNDAFSYTTGLSSPQGRMTESVRNSRRRIRAQSASDPPMGGFRSSDYQRVRRLKQISCPTQSPHPGSRNRGDSNPPVAPWCLQKGRQQLQLHCLGVVSLWQCSPVSRDWPSARLPFLAASSFTDTCPAMTSFHASCDLRSLSTWSV